MTSWEVRVDCPILCAIPKVCWEPTTYSAPQLCLAPGVNPNTFENYLSISEGNALVILGLFLIIGIILGLCFCFLLLIGFSDCLFRRRSLRQHKKAHNTEQSVDSNRHSTARLNPSLPSLPSRPLFIRATGTPV
ncbi:hypothetical protein niasHT_040164 [Heterodera trifolii]|uniref:Uncharacterized protein n=1 Tax=Heterodera trifolii TaxID=157864 RepID=A0ABD2IG21_9BILA